MKFLLDENISWRIVKAFSYDFAECAHVTEFFKKADDFTIWNFAKQNGWTIITIDYDFRILSEFYMTPPKVIHLKVNNISNKEIAKKLIDFQNVISEFCISDDHLLLEIT
ncbi:MAG: DUF5615 family PIN-like protein [Chitinophagales bacterium]|jgi:predicted nuclease of predicted toxin-antitoxin system|nr:DUF5615 family PIN-like protein [Chitinophagales bacterium]